MELVLDFGNSWGKWYNPVTDRYGNFRHAIAELSEVDWRRYVGRVGNSPDGYLRVNGTPYAVGDAARRHRITDRPLGASRHAYQLVVKRGVKPEKSKPEHSVCSIGFCEREQKWYGWSHRAICRFGIGDKLFDEWFEGADDHTPFIQHGTKTIETLDEARQAAVNFAEYIS